MQSPVKTTDKKMSNRQKTCIFCGQPLRPKGSRKNAKSDEHVIPNWLLKHLGITGSRVVPMRVQEGKGIVDLREHVLGAFVAGIVCAHCNNGWMSNLEGQVKPILVRLIDDKKELETLSDDERFTLARWTLKTAAVLNRSSTYGNPSVENSRPVPDEHLLTVAAGNIPTDVLVVGAGYDSKKTFDFLQYTLWKFPAASIQLSAEDCERSYKIALSFRDLVLIAAYYPSPAYAYILNPKHYVRLWTGSRKVSMNDFLMNVSPAKSWSPILEGLLRNIMVASNTWLTLVENVATTRLIV